MRKGENHRYESEDEEKMAILVPVATVTKYHKLGGSKQL